MTTRRLLPAVAGLVLSAAGVQAAPASMDALRGARRVVVTVAPTPDDRRLSEQRRILTEWGRGADERDVTAVAVAGDKVEGVSDPASELRARYGIARDEFVVLLIGKDGHVAGRSNQPLLAADLNGRIDAMPMRRAGQR